MLTLAIRQPFAELILRFFKTADLRSPATAIVVVAAVSAALHCFETAEDGGR